METPAELITEIVELKARLTEAEQTLHAIRSGEVDALVVSGAGGDQVFTLKGAEMPYRILVEEMNQGALIILPDGTIVYANIRFALLSKTPLEQVISSSWQRFFAPEAHPHLQACLNAIAPASPPKEWSLQVADGSRCPVQLSLCPMNASGVEGFSVIVTDLTERKQSENALRKTSEELLEKNGALEAFSRTISHDIRAPLRAMQGFIQILLEDYGGKLEPEAKSHLDRIESSATRLDRLIHDVLAYSKLSHGENEVATFDLDHMVRETVETYPNLRDAPIEIATSPARVMGHELAFGQCVSNLLGNALKFMPPGRVPQVRVWTQTIKRRLRLWVQDNGIGILPQDQAKIFDVFSRLHGADYYEGTGLGLSMVKKAVEKMGGQVGVESEIGQGSRFWIELACA
jgi:PAS domain S-box-containing protein